MSMIGVVQNFIGQISGAVNGKDNPLGLSPGQVDQINQILTLIKNLISDGIQRGDVSKMVTLLGEIAEVIPEVQAEIKEIVQGLKKLAKKLFEDPNMMKNNQVNQVSKGVLGLESDMLLSQEVGERGVLSEDKILKDLGGLASSRPDEIMIDQSILSETSEDRLKLAEQILNIVNDNLVLSQANFDKLTKGLKAIQNRASLESNLVNDNKVSGIGPTA